jgi:anti-sigma factor RsiW
LTKVNRCLTEGRRALAVELAAIEGGGACAKLEPFLVVLVDGDSSADEQAVLRRHLKTCLDCRARLRSLRAAGQTRDRDRPPGRD